MIKTTAAEETATAMAPEFVPIVLGDFVGSSRVGDRLGALVGNPRVGATLGDCVEESTISAS